MTGAEGRRRAVRFQRPGRVTKRTWLIRGFRYQDALAVPVESAHMHSTVPIEMIPREIHKLPDIVVVGEGVNRCPFASGPRAATGEGHTGHPHAILVLRASRGKNANGKHMAERVFHRELSNR